MIRALWLIMKNNIFRFGDSHWLKIKGTAMVTPPVQTYATVFYGVFGLLLIERFGKNLFLYRRLIDDVLALRKRYDEKRDSAELRAFQETIQDWYGPEWTSQGPFLKLEVIEPTITIKENRTTTTLFEKKLNLYLYIITKNFLTHKESSTRSSIYRFTASPLCVLKNSTRKA